MDAFVQCSQNMTFDCQSPCPLMFSGALRSASQAPWCFLVCGCGAFPPTPSRRALLHRVHHPADCQILAAALPAPARPSAPPSPPRAWRASGRRSARPERAGPRSTGSRAEAAAPAAGSVSAASLAPPWNGSLAASRWPAPPARRRGDTAAACLQGAKAGLAMQPPPARGP